MPSKSSKRNKPSMSRWARDMRRQQQGEPSRMHVALLRTCKSVNAASGVSLSTRAIWMLNGHLDELTSRVADTAFRMMKYAGRTTLKARDMRAATRALLSGELMEHADTEGMRAVEAFNKC